MTTNHYTDPFDTSFWFEMDEIHCPCMGDGWANINDEWEECPVHHNGQLHPQSRSLLQDDPVALLESERISILNWKIGRVRGEIIDHQEKLKAAQHKLFLLELECINKTPTTKIEAINITAKCYPTVQMPAVRPEGSK